MSSGFAIGLGKVCLISVGTSTLLSTNQLLIGSGFYLVLPGEEINNARSILRFGRLTNLNRIWEGLNALGKIPSEV